MGLAFSGSRQGSGECVIESGEGEEGKREREREGKKRWRVGRREREEGG